MPRFIGFPPLINGSAIHTKLVMAFTLHGAMTVEELMAVTGIAGRTHVQKRLGELLKKKIVTKYAWGGNEFLKGGKKPTNWRIANLMWALDPRHPLYKHMRNLARGLSKAYPLPGERAQKSDRHYKGPRTPVHELEPEQIQILGGSQQARIILLLARANGLGTEQISGLLGKGRATYMSLRHLRRWGIVRTDRSGNQNRTSLDPTFCAAHALRQLALVIDDLMPTSEYSGLALARRHHLNLARLRQINGRRARRREQGGSYFKTPTGFAVTGNEFALDLRWPKRKKDETRRPQSE